MLHTNLSKSIVRFLSIVGAALVLVAMTACGGQAPLQSEAEAPAAEPPAYDQGLVEQAGAMETVMEETAMEEPASAEYDDAPADTSTHIGPITNTPNVYQRLIIKNAELALTVEETDTAINRGLGIVNEYNGYVVSNRTWFSGEYKYATLSIGVPAENFEEMLRRMKDLAVSVENETVSGQDVTDEFVDLESRLRNLEATAARIRTFMDQATDVEESLAVSAQLSNVEAEIEQTKGRMNYLKDRATFSTITVQISPEIPTQTYVPESWSVSRSVERAINLSGDIATGLFRIVTEVTVFVVIVLLPFLVPVIGLIWVGIKLIRRMGASKAEAS